MMSVDSTVYKVIVALEHKGVFFQVLFTMLWADSLREGIYEYRHSVGWLMSRRIFDFPISYPVGFMLVFLLSLSDEENYAKNIRNPNSFTTFNT